MKNNFLLGIIIGVVFPLIAYLLTNFTSVQKSMFSDKPIALYAVAGLVNLLIMRFAFKDGKDATAKGVVLITFLSMIAMIFLMRVKV